MGLEPNKDDLLVYLLTGGEARRIHLFWTLYGVGERPGLGISLPRITNQTKEASRRRGLQDFDLPQDRSLAVPASGSFLRTRPRQVRQLAADVRGGGGRAAVVRRGGPRRGSADGGPAARVRTPPYHRRGSGGSTGAAAASWSLGVVTGFAVVSWGRGVERRGSQTLIGSREGRNTIGDSTRPLLEIPLPHRHPPLPCPPVSSRIPLQGRYMWVDVLPSVGEEPQRRGAGGCVNESIPLV